MLAALYVETNGCYFGVPGIDPWDINRDARGYDGPYPAVAHPPCERWGRYANGGPASKTVKTPKDDQGCFAAALGAIDEFGGVLEHPAYSLAWTEFGIPRPPLHGGWIAAGSGAWTCHVEQGHYGHRARKATWLYTVGPKPPELKWGHSGQRLPPNGRVRTGIIQNMSRNQRLRTPPQFRDLLISIARNAQ
jgi:hypothetical protein